MGISIIYAAQTWRQLAGLVGDTEARAILGLTNILALFGGSKDVGFNKEISDLVGTTRIARTTWQHGSRGGRTTSGDDMLILRPEEIRQLPERHALIVAENTRPIIARLHRSIDGRNGRALLTQQAAARAAPADHHANQPGDQARAIAALAAAREHALLDD